MKKYALFYPIFLLFIFTVLCKGQNKIDSSKDSLLRPLIYYPAKSTTNLPDYDPYFTGTNTIFTSQGPISITRNIIQDRNENFWFATFEGIIRYDGNTFTNVTNKEGLRRYRVFAAIEDTKGNIW